MSDTRVKDSTPLEQLKARVESKFGHVSKAETVEELIADMERVSRFLIVPPEFMEMLRDMAASEGKHGADSLHTSLKIRGMDPAWVELIEGRYDVDDFEELKEGVARITAYPLKSMLFRTLLKELKRIRHPARVPDEFMEVLAGLVEEEAAREAEENAREAQTARFAEIEGTDSEFTMRLVALARREGLDVSESSTAMELMERLRSLANVHSGLRLRLEPFQAELRGEEVEPVEEATAAPEAVEEDEVEQPAVAGEEKAMEEAEPIPLFVMTYSNMKGIEWAEGERKGSFGFDDDKLMISAYGYAIFGKDKRRTVNFGVPADSGISAFLLIDPTTGLVSVGKFPYIASMEGALAKIAAKQRITKEDLARDPETIPVRSRKTTRYRTIERLRSSTSPHEVELKRINKQVKKLDLSLERFVAGAIFFSGRPGKDEFGAPPAQVITMLGALRSVGIGYVSIGMYFYPEMGSSELIYGADDGLLRVGRRKLLDLDVNGAVDVDEILSLASDLMAGLKGGTKDLKFVEAIETYHLPVAIGLWGDSPAQLKKKMKGIIKTASKKEGDAREKYLLSSYLRWHSMLPRGLNGGKMKGKPSSGNGGGGGSIRGIVREAPTRKAELHEFLTAAHYECDVAAAVLGGAAVNTGVLPIAYHPHIVV
jgi:hypothetical protein